MRATAWQQLTTQWWVQEEPNYELFVSELVLAEAGAGDARAAQWRLESLQDIRELAASEKAKMLAKRLVIDGGVPEHAEADALHIAIAAVHAVDYFLTWNCRHINNATT